MVRRKKEEIKEVLFEKGLCTTSYISEATKIFMNFLREHPEIKEDDVDMDIETEEMEEDHYGNGGGIRRSVQIYRTREETDGEYQRRIEKEEEDVLFTFKRTLSKAASGAKYDFDTESGDEHCEKLFTIGRSILADKLGIELDRDYANKTEFPEGVTIIEDFLKRFADEISDCCWDTHGEGGEQREIEDVINEYTKELTSILNATDTPNPELLTEIDLSIRRMPGMHTYDKNGDWYKGSYDNLVALCVHIAEWQTKRIEK